MTMIDVRDQRSGTTTRYENWHDWRQRRKPPRGVWRPCLTCWGQRTILSPAANGEGLIPVDCWTCLGIGVLPA